MPKQRITKPPSTGRSLPKRLGTCKRKILIYNKLTIEATPLQLNHTYSVPPARIAELARQHKQHSYSIVDIHRILYRHPVDYLQPAIRAIRTAETALSNLIQCAMQSRDYFEAKRLLEAVANVARALSALEQAPENAPGAPPTGGLGSRGIERHSDSGAPPDLEHERAWKRISKAQLPPFPRFERDADRLVKIGWSAKDQRTYEHRVAVDIVRDFCRFLAHIGKERRTFRIEELTRVKASDGTDVPSYQIYLVLKWLQSVGAISRRGNDGYVVKDGELSPGRTEEHWLATPSRGIDQSAPQPRTQTQTNE
jgi:hypothetical protein